MPTKMDLSVTSKVYEPKTNRYIYQAQLPESMDYGMVDGAAVAFTAQSQGKHEHGGVIPTSAVTFDETVPPFCPQRTGTGLGTNITRKNASRRRKRLPEGRWR